VTLSVFIDSRTSINAIGGKISFPSKLLTVDHISKNDSIVDLWSEEPLIDQVAGTIFFSGGITGDTGYREKGELFSITFITKQEGIGHIDIQDGELLARDGNGTPIEYRTSPSTLYIRKPGTPSPDVNADGQLSFSDINLIYLASFRSYNPKYDLNSDGKNNWNDVRYWITSTNS
jgi:hypothetical protein